VGELRQRLKDIWGRAQHALFSLIVRRHLVLSRGASVLPATWKQILAGLEATLAVEELERSTPRAPPPPPPQPAFPPPAPARTPPPISKATVPAIPAMVAHATPPPIAPRADTRSTMRGLDGGATWGNAGQEPHRDFKGAGVGWRSQQRPRSPEADQLFRQATLEAEAGKVDGAIAMLRQALHLSPGDPEIAALLGKLAFRDRSKPLK
jgi:hypothetical protein